MAKKRKQAGDPGWSCNAQKPCGTGTFEAQRVLGRGSFGIVHPGRLSNGTVAAVKVMDAKHDINAFMREVAGLFVLEHLHLVRGLGDMVAHFVDGELQRTGSAD